MKLNKDIKNTNMDYTKKSLISILIFLCLVSCNNHKKTTISLGEVKFYKEFPREITLEEISDVFTDEMGLTSIKVLKDYIILSHGSHWSIYSKDNLKKVNDILSIGQGPNEFLSVPYASACLYLTKDNDSTYCYMRDEMKHRIVELNITKAIEGDVTLIPSLENESISSSTWDITPLAPGEALLHEPYDEYTGFKRLYLSTDTLYEVPSTLKLSEAKVKDEDDINYLVKTARYNPSKNKIIEAMRRFNQLNIYSIDKDWGVTVCIGDRLDNVENIVSPNMITGRNEAYKSCTAWDDTFGAIYTGASEFEINSGLKNTSEIQIFDWDGNPLARISFNRRIVGFDCDFDKYILYAIDGNEDKIIEYDISDYMDIFNRPDKGDA